MIQAIGILLMWLGGAVMIGSLLPIESSGGVQFGWLMLVGGYGWVQASHTPPPPRKPLVQGEDPYMA